MAGFMKSKGSKTPKTPKTPKTQKTGNSMTPSKSNPKTPQSDGGTPGKGIGGKIKSNKKSCIVISILGCLVMALMITLLVFLFLSPSAKKVCETPECLTLAQQLHNWKDESVDPCQDFFKYSCGKFIEHSTTSGAISKQNTIVAGLIKDYFKKTEKKTTTSKSENVMKSFINNCESEKKQIFESGDADSYETKQYLKLHDLMDYVDSWPIADENWNENSFDLTNLMVNLAIPHEGSIKTGFFSILAAASGKLVFMPEKLAPINVDVVSRNIYRFLEIYEKNKNPKKPKQPDYNAIVGEVKSAALFASVLNQIMFDPKPISPREEKMPLTSYDELRILSYPWDFDRILGSFKLSIRGTKYKPTIKNHIYFVTRDLLLNQLYLTVSKRVIANFMYIRYFNEAVEVIQAAQSNHPLSCAKVAIDILPTAATRVFIRNHFDKESLKDVSNLVETIRENFVEMLKGSEWLSSSTREFVLKKARTMKKVIGYPEEYEKPGELDKEFDINRISPYSILIFMWNEIREFNIKLIMSFAYKETTINPAALTFSTNANYGMTTNTLTVLAPIINDPLFHHTWPNYAKIAGIGFILGHEIGHGFDNTGIHFDENGDITDKFQTGDKDRYGARWQCLINQYDNYDDPDFGKGKLKGKKTIGEMMPDLMAAEVTWKAFKKLDMANEEKLIGFENYSPEKLFFQIGATNWCQAGSSLTLKQQLEDPHATNSFRINGIFADRKEFAEAYNCPVGSPMNPVKKCELF